MQAEKDPGSSDNSFEMIADIMKAEIQVIFELCQRVLDALWNAS